MRDAKQRLAALDLRIAEAGDRLAYQRELVQRCEGYGDMKSAALAARSVETLEVTLVAMHRIRQRYLAATVTESTTASVLRTTGVQHR